MTKCVLDTKQIAAIRTDYVRGLDYGRSNLTTLIIRAANEGAESQRKEVERLNVKVAELCLTINEMSGDQP